jgi:hypothetical protein
MKYMMAKTITSGKRNSKILPPPAADWAKAGEINIKASVRIEAEYSDAAH